MEVYPHVGEYLQNLLPQILDHAKLPLCTLLATAGLGSFRHPVLLVKSGSRSLGRFGRTTDVEVSLPPSALLVELCIDTLLG